MTVDETTRLCLQFLAKVVRRQCDHLNQTTQQLSVLTSSIIPAQEFVPTIIGTAQRLCAAVDDRGWGVQRSEEH